MSFVVGFLGSSVALVTYGFEKTSLFLEKVLFAPHECNHHIESLMQNDDFEAFKEAVQRLPKNVEYFQWIYSPFCQPKHILALKKCVPSPAYRAEILSGLAPYERFFSSRLLTPALLWAFIEAFPLECRETFYLGEAIYVIEGKWTISRDHALNEKTRFINFFSQLVSHPNFSGDLFRAFLEPASEKLRVKIYKYLAEENGLSLFLKRNEVVAEDVLAFFEFCPETEQFDQLLNYDRASFEKTCDQIRFPLLAFELARKYPELKRLFNREGIVFLVDGTPLFPEENLQQLADAVSIPLHYIPCLSFENFKLLKASLKDKSLSPFNHFNIFFQKPLLGLKSTLSPEELNSERSVTFKCGDSKVLYGFEIELLQSEMLKALFFRRKDFLKDSHHFQEMTLEELKAILSFLNDRTKCFESQEEALSFYTISANYDIPAIKKRAIEWFEEEYSTTFDPDLLEEVLSLPPLFYLHEKYLKAYSRHIKDKAEVPEFYKKLKASGLFYDKPYTNLRAELQAILSDFLN